MRSRITLILAAWALGLTASARAYSANHTDISVKTSPHPEIRYMPGEVVYVEGLADGRWVGQYWNAGGRINVPYELRAEKPPNPRPWILRVLITRFKCNSETCGSITAGV